MRGRFLFGIALLLVLLPAVVARAADAGAGQKPGDAEALFRSAFAQDVTPADRVLLLERVVKEHADSVWADDALWVLGEAARRQGLTLHVVYYWQFLISRWPAAHLEDYTRTLDIYRLSSVATVQQLMEVEGTLYTPQRGRVIPGKDATTFAYNNAVAFNPVPMLVWEGLGDSYLELGKLDLAATAYANALAAAPPAGPLSDLFRDRISQKQDKVKVRASAAAAQAPITAQAARSAPAGTPTLKPADAPRTTGAAAPPAAPPAAPSAAHAAQGRDDAQ